MAEARIERRLAAILAGYSRLMGVDEEGTASSERDIEAAFELPSVNATLALQSGVP